MEREKMWFWLCNQNGIYRSHIEKLLKVFDIEELFTVDKHFIMDTVKMKFPELEKSVMKSLDQMLENRDGETIKKSFEKLLMRDIRFISCESRDYPEKFKNLPDYPYGIYVKGNLPREDCISVGMIGARICSDYGRAMTKKFAEALSRNNIQIISGMAAGIDAESSLGAINAGGRTYVVLGCGVDVIYPTENVDLYDAILNSGGGIISEFPPGTRPYAWQFPHRNRLISALSDCILVMEARKRSGTLTTVSQALDQGKDIFALPGRATDSLSVSCNQLISEGAGLLSTPEALLELLKKDYGAELDTFSGGFFEIQEGFNELTADETEVYKELDYTPKSADEIADTTGLDLFSVMEVLTELELNGLAMEHGTGLYVRQM